MVIRNTFAGTLSDAELNVSKSISLHLTSATTSTSVSHYPVWSKLLLDSIYTTLVDAGYTPTKNEEEYSIEIWGFKFYVFGYSYSSSYGIVPYIYITSYGSVYNDNVTGTSASLRLQINKERSQTSITSDKYSFTITIRGNDDMFMIQLGSYSYPTMQYDLLFLAKAHYLPKDKDGIVIGTGLGINTYSRYTAVTIDDVYTPIMNRMNNVFHYTSDYSNTDVGIGLGYYKIPLTTRDYDFVLKGMIYTNFMKVEAGNYYKLGNEIYYAHNSYDNSSPFLYKVDTIPTDV